MSMKSSDTHKFAVLDLPSVKVDHTQVSDQHLDISELFTYSHLL